MKTEGITCQNKFIQRLGINAICQINMFCFNYPFELKSNLAISF